MLPLAIQIGYFVCLIACGLLGLRFNYLLSSKYPHEYRTKSGYPSDNNEPQEVWRRGSLEWRYWWNREYRSLPDPEINRLGEWMRFAFYGALILFIPATIAFLSKSGNAV